MTAPIPFINSDFHNEPEELDDDPASDPNEISEEEIIKIREEVLKQLKDLHRKDPMFIELLIDVVKHVRRFHKKASEVTVLTAINIPNLFEGWGHCFRDERNQNNFGFLTHHGNLVTLPLEKGNAKSIKPCFLDLIQEDGLGYGSWLNFEYREMTFQYVRQYDKKKQKHIYRKKPIRWTAYIQTILMNCFVLHATLARSRIPQLYLDPQLHCDKPTLVLEDGVAHMRLVYPVKQLRAPLESYDHRYVEDYRQHWHAFDDFLEMLFAYRFGENAKRGYFWMHYETDWGKTLLFGDGGILHQLGLVVSTSVEEINKAFTGDNCGLTLEQFKNTWILHIDEFQNISNSVKKMDSVISFTAKWKASTSVRIYLKVFTSADNVASSLTGAGLGSESQQLTRWMYDNQSNGAIQKRPLFQKNPALYRDHVTTYIAQYLNRRMEEIRAKDRYEVSQYCLDIINRLFDKYSIRHSFGELKESLEEIAWKLEDVIRDGFTAFDVDINQYKSDSLFAGMNRQFQAQWKSGCERFVYKGKDFIFVSGRSVESLFSSYVETMYGKNLWITLKPRAKEINRLLHWIEVANWENEGCPRITLSNGDRRRGIAFPLGQPK